MLAASGNFAAADGRFSWPLTALVIRIWSAGLRVQASHFDRQGSEMRATTLGLAFDTQGANTTVRCELIPLRQRDLCEEGLLTSMPQPDELRFFATVTVQTVPGCSVDDICRKRH